MYVCGFCRGAAVAITNPGLVGVWKWASLSCFSFIIFVILIGNMVLTLVLCYMMGNRTVHNSVQSKSEMNQTITPVHKNRIEP